MRGNRLQAGIDSLVFSVLKEGPASTSAVRERLLQIPRWMALVERARKYSVDFSATESLSYWLSCCLDHSLHRLRKAGRIRLDKTRFCGSKWAIVGPVKVVSPRVVSHVTPWDDLEEPLDALWYASAAEDQIAHLTARIADLERFVRDIRDNYDCDADAHRYGYADSQCRVCKATALLSAATQEARHD